MFFGHELAIWFAKSKLTSDECAATAPETMDDIDLAKSCLCAASFAELSANCVRRPQAGDEEDEWIRDEQQPAASPSFKASGGSPSMSPSATSASPLSPLSPLSPPLGVGPEVTGGRRPSPPNGECSAAPRARR